MPVVSALSPPQCEFANIKEVQNKDQSIAQLVAYLQTGEIAGNFSDDRKLVSKANQYVLQDGILYHLYSPTMPYNRQKTCCQRVPLQSLMNEILGRMHDDVNCRSLRSRKNI